MELWIEGLALYPRYLGRPTCLSFGTIMSGGRQPNNYLLDPICTLDLKMQPPERKQTQMINIFSFQSHLIVLHFHASLHCSVTTVTLDQFYGINASYTAHTIQHNSCGSTQLAGLNATNAMELTQLVGAYPCSQMSVGPRCVGTKKEKTTKSDL